MLSKKTSKFGIALFVLGLIIAVVGLSFLVAGVFGFLSGFSNPSFSSNPFSSDPYHYNGYPFNRPVLNPFQKAFLGAIITSIGAILVKVGFGLGLVGNVDTIKDAVSGIFSPRETQTKPFTATVCPNCQKNNPPGAIFCTNCGLKMED